MARSGIGKTLSLVLLYEIHDIERFTRVQNFCSYARLVKCVHESAGKRSGKSWRKIGNVHLKWAFSEAAAPFLRANRGIAVRRSRSARVILAVTLHRCLVQRLSTCIHTKQSRDVLPIRYS